MKLTEDPYPTANGPDRLRELLLAAGNEIDRLTALLDSLDAAPGHLATACHEQQLDGESLLDLSSALVSSIGHLRNLCDTTSNSCTTAMCRIDITAAVLQAGSSAD